MDTGQDSPPPEYGTLIHEEPPPEYSSLLDDRPPSPPPPPQVLSSEEEECVPNSLDLLTAQPLQQHGTIYHHHNPPLSPVTRVVDMIEERRNLYDTVALQILIVCILVTLFVIGPYIKNLSYPNSTLVPDLVAIVVILFVVLICFLCHCHHVGKFGRALTYIIILLIAFTAAILLYSD